MTPNSPPTRLPLWQKKQPITAQRLSGIVDAINRGASGAAPPSQVFANINTPQISYAKIVAVHGSYLAVTDAGGAAFYVAKPPRLRSDERRIQYLKLGARCPRTDLMRSKLLQAGQHAGAGQQFQVMGQGRRITRILELPDHLLV